VNPLGVLGGSFDPVHRGHVAIADHALRRLGLGCVLFLPCADPPHKPGRALAARHHRLEMLFLALEARPGLRVSTFEIGNRGVCYTIDTMRSLRSGAPSSPPVFLCGFDAIADVGSWREHEALLAEFDFVACTRPDERGEPVGSGWPDIVTRRLAPFPPVAETPLGAGGRVFRLEIPPLPVSSSLVRTRSAEGRSIDDLVPARVARYIRRHRLYPEEAAR